MNKERATYMQTLKRKCSLAKNPSKQEVQAYSACALNHYNGSRLKPMDDKQAKCSKKNCDHLIRVGGKHSKEIQTRRSGQRTRRRRGGTHSYYNTSQFSRNQPGKASINSAYANSRASRQSRSFAEKNELDAAQTQLVNDLAEQVIQLEASKGENRNVVIGEFLRLWFEPNLTEEEKMQKINTMIPEGHEKTRFEHYGRILNLTLRKLLYYTLIMTVIASLAASKGKPNFKSTGPMT
jgi:hypothetical protein